MIRNFLFSFFFFLGIAFFYFIYSVTFNATKNSFIWRQTHGSLVIYLFKIFFSTKITIKGKENIITNEKFFIAASHQSMFETFFLQTIFNSPVFILKKNYF